MQSEKKTTLLSNYLCFVIVSLRTVGLFILTLLSFFGVVAVASFPLISWWSIFHIQLPIEITKAFSRYPGFAPFNHFTPSDICLEPQEQNKKKCVGIQSSGSCACWVTGTWNIIKWGERVVMLCHHWIQSISWSSVLFRITEDGQSLKAQWYQYWL